ncbi:MAG: gliding motility protein GldL [Muribaculaceae bacterium]|nr:gliding motility protein GldL [Muribaculaceae bacterium]
MGKVKYYRNALSRFISSENGQRFFNFAYSIGAAIVIWGALFKILHLPGGNTLLSIGMGTEVMMFILTAFDRPPREYKWEQVFPQFSDEEAEGAEPLVVTNVGPSPAQVQGATGTVNGRETASVPATSGGNALSSQGGDAAVDAMAAMAEEMSRLRATTKALNEVSETLLASYKAITDNSANITAASTGYVDQMQALDRNIAGLNTIYEIQLRSISGQLEAIERVNKGIKNISEMYAKASEAGVDYCQESEKMAHYMQQLNQVYARMITAMTVNMYRPPMPGEPMPAPEAPAQ